MMSSSSSSSSSDDGECSSSTEQPPLPVEDEIIVSAAEAEVEAEEAEDPSSSPPSSSPPSSSESSSGSSSSSSGSSSNSSPTTTASATKSLPTAASAGAADDHTTATVTTAVSTNTNSNSSSPPTTSSSTSTSSTNSNESSNASNATTPPATTDTRRRVKLYMLNANRTWDDRGTGHVSSSYVDRLNGVSLLVKAETDGSLLLESRILADTAYQKQQDTLIVWSEGENYDLALSFQERVGCEEIWAKICQVQGKDPSVDITQDIMEDDDNELPPCEADRLDEISTIISSSLTMQAKKDSITLALETENYIPKLLTLFRALEERKDISALSKMYDIFKSIFLLNRNSLFDIMLSEEALWDVIGVFEYDPTGARVREAAEEAKKRAVASMAAREAKEAAAAAGSSETEGGPSTPPGPGESGSQHQLRAVNTNSAKPETYFNSLPASTESELSRLIREKRHREFLKNVSRFKEVIPLSKSELVAKIHQTYRVQYIQDVILPTPSVFEDNMLSTLSSFIFFNKVEIVSLIQQDDKFLKELFRQLADGSREFREKRRDLVLFLKELCTFSHTLQLQNREVFIKTLANLGLLHTLELLLSADDVPVKLGAVDILTYIVDYSPSMVREYALQQDQNEKEGIRFSAIPPHLQLSSEKYLLNIIIIQMICDVDPDLGMATQLSNILKLLIDPENMLTTSPINKSEKSEFLNHFYRHSINYLTKPILSATHIDTTSATASPEVIAAQQRAIEFSLSYEQSCQSAQLFAIILELLTFCIEHHAYHIRSYLLSKEIVRSIMVLTKSKHTFLVLAVIRFVRRLVGLKDEFYNRHITNVNLFAPIIDALLANKGRYNLLDSAIIDLFEFINSNSILSLINYTMEHFWKGKLERIDYVRTFRLMRNFYETQSQMRERLDSQSFLLARHRFRRDPRQLDKEEDMWFNNEEDDDEEECAEDDEDEDCENYHDDDGEGGLPDSPPSSQRHLQQAVAAAAAAAANTTTAASETIGFYTNAAAAAAAAAAALVSGTAGSTSPSAHKSQSSAVNSAGDGGSGSPLHSLSHHNLAHQQQQSSVSSTTSSTGGAYDGGAGQGQGHGHSSSSSPSSSAYDSPTSAFIDSPFFSSFSASKRRKFSEKKTLTINLNTKGSGYLNTTTTSSSSASTTTNNGGSNSSTSSSQVLSTVGFISSNHSSPVTSTPAASTASTTTSTTPSLFAKSFAQVNSLLIGAAAAAGAQAAAMANLAVSATAGGADGGAVVGYQQKELLSRKRALVDYPDEDSDEDDADDDEAEGEDHEEEEEEEDLMDVDEDS